jgi:hypothetical protein
LRALEHELLSLPWPTSMYSRIDESDSSAISNQINQEYQFREIIWMVMW